MQITDKPNVQENECLAVTIGKFDGIHSGHEFLISKVVEKKKEGLIPAALTFNMREQHIYSDTERLLIFEENGIELLITYEFDETLKNMTSEEFVKNILVDGLHAKYVCAGDDFRFGRNRAGDADILIQLGKTYGFEVEIIERKSFDGDVISSSRVRNELDKGAVDKVAQLLGRYYSVTGEVIYGNQIGRTIGFPTVNQKVQDDKSMPANGVYATRVVHKDKIYSSITNVGVKPTIEGENKLGVETYIFDFDEQIYGEVITVEFVKFIRSEQKFNGLEELQKQIDEDKEKAKAILKK